MNYLVSNLDIMEEVVFYDNEVEKAREYWEVEETCEDLIDVAIWWNMHHAGDAIGELVVRPVNSITEEF